MESKNLAVFGIFPTRLQVERAVSELKASGFGQSDVSVLFSSPDDSHEFAHENTTKIPEGATAGLVTGITLGGVLGWLAGVGTLAIPGAGPFIAAGPIMASLAGAGLVGTVGGLVGALIGLGIPEYEAKRYEGRMNDGGILLSVHSNTSENAKLAMQILERTGAEDISERGEASANDDRPKKRVDYTDSDIVHR